MATKARSVYIHAKRSFDQRYGIKLDETTYNYILERIRSGDERTARFLISQSNRLAVWSILFDKTISADFTEPKFIPIVYDRERKIIVTALPECCNDPSMIGVYT